MHALLAHSISLPSLFRYTFAMAVSIMFWPKTWEYVYILIPLLSNEYKHLFVWISNNFIEKNSTKASNPKKQEA
jgi:hypothetical protein